MNENIDLTKILKDCPEGTEFYSSYFGKVTFVRILYGQIIVGCAKIHRQVVFNANGKYEMLAYSDNNGNYLFSDECLLFPSKNQRDWDKFIAPWYKKDKFDPKTLQPFDKVLVRENYPTENWYAAYFSHIEYDVSKYDLDVYEETPEFIICITGSSGFCYCIPYNDETKHLVGTEDEAPKYYRYWEE